jgi:uncharacterized protein YaiE (UPF0345 family)
VTTSKRRTVEGEGKGRTPHGIVPDGTKKTLGVMLPGDYEFGTSDSEIMEMLGGEMDVLLPGEKIWKTFKAGESYTVPANSKFKLKVKGVADYCCSYVK